MTSPEALIDTSDAFDAAFQRIESASLLAFDVEANGFYHYNERTCILTVSTPDLDVAIDSLALWDRMPELAPVFADPARPILAHGATYDVARLKRDFGYTFAGLFDSMVAAQLLDHPKIGLADLARHYVGIDLPKELQRHNWAERPIRPEHLAYLLDDTRHLFTLREQLTRELEAKDLTEEFAIDCGLVEQQTPAPATERDAEDYRRIKDHKLLSPHQRGALKALYALRNRIASAMDLATFRVISNATLLDVARSEPQTMDHLANCDGMPSRILRVHGKELLDALQIGRGDPQPRYLVSDAPPSRRPRPGDEERTLSRTLKTWRTEEAQRRGIGVQAVLPTSVLEAIVRDPPHSAPEFASRPRVGARRAERYGAIILGMVRDAAGR